MQKEKPSLTEQTSINIAFVGHPNSGKTSLFNALHGTHYDVGNWCGVTVSLNRLTTTSEGMQCEWVDLPGIESLNSENNEASLDNQITQNYLNSNEADYIINVIDARRLESELSLTLELLKKGNDLILVLNMMDLAQKQGQSIDTIAMAKYLGCPVVATTAIVNQGLDTLKAAILQKNKEITCKKITAPASGPVRSTIHSSSQAKKIARLYSKQMNQPQNWTPIIDSFVLHKWLGLPILLFFMYLAFGFTIHIGGGIQDFFEQMLNTVFIEWPETFLKAYQAPLWLRNICVQGLGTGIITTLGFVPVIGGMYFCVSLLETSGYMSRAALVMDKFMQRLGLSGKSFIPMILGFGCNVPAILSTRILESQKQRILTILMSPFMSCGARLAIYALFVTAFFKDGGHNIIFMLYCIGILMAIFTGWLFKKTLLSGEDEGDCPITLTDYRWPSLSLLLRTTQHRTLRFVAKAGVIILPLCALIGLLSSFTTALDESWLSYLARSITPCLSPMGIEPDNWPATVGLLTGILAKEVVVGTLSAFYAGSNSLGALVEHFGTHQAAFAYLLFVLLYFPCVSVFATIAKELSLAWATFTALWTTSLAYTVAVGYYQISTFKEHWLSSFMWISGLILWGLLLCVVLRWLGSKDIIGRHKALLSKDSNAKRKNLRPVPTHVTVNA